MHSFFKAPRLRRRSVVPDIIITKRRLPFVLLFSITPVFVFAQSTDIALAKKDTLNTAKNVLQTAKDTSQLITHISGKVTDAKTSKPLSFISIGVDGSSYGTNTNDAGEFDLKAPGAFTKVTFSYVGYQSITKIISPGKDNQLIIRLAGRNTQLKEVVVKSSKKQPYKNKGNPAVELIQQIIDHKAQNRMQSSNYLQYDQYERIGFSVYDFPKSFLNSAFLRPYQFMIDTLHKVNGKTQTSIPVYLSEKLSEHYYRKEPSKTIEVVKARKASNIIKFIDTAGLNIYLNRLYGNTIDIYDNNIFIITNQFLSPIADHSPNYYKFFITDTIQTDKGKLVQLSFTPRNKGDLLFEGTLYVTLNGRYAVQGCDLNVNKQININFMRSLNIHLDFEDHADGRYYLKKSNVKADFGLLKEKGTSFFGERTVTYSNYKLGTPLKPDFYEGNSEQVVANAEKPDTSFWNKNRGDSLTTQQATTYAHIGRLEQMKSYKRLSWLGSTVTGGYANVGPVQIGLIGQTYSYDYIEASRFQIGGRTTPELNKTVYFEGYGAYGTRDQKFKYTLSTYLSLNQTPYYRFPNDYFKVSYQYDVGIPGQNSSITGTQSALASSFQTGTSHYFQYNKIFRIDYVKDFENHLSYNVTLKNWNQQATGDLVYRLNDAGNTIVNSLTTTEIGLHIRYVPHEQFLQGTRKRRTIYSKYPIFNLQVDKGVKGVFNSSYNYTNFNLNIAKRFYFSQLGTADATLLGGYLAGQVPFPLLNIARANQSLGYEPNAYNKMYYLEFVSDHFAGINYTQNFNGFFLNKIPLIEHLKWREFLSFRALVGGIRTENDPAFSKGLYQFPKGSAGINGTYALGSTPYLEGGLGIGNIFKLLRVDVIRRFNYLDHPGVSPYGVKFSVNFDL